MNIRDNIVKVHIAVDLQGDSQVDPQTTLTMLLWSSSEWNLMVEIFKGSFQLKWFAGKITQGDTLEDFKKLAQRNGITVCAPGTSKITHYIS